MDMDDSDQEDEAAPPLPPGPPPPPQHGEVSEERGRGEGEGDEEAAFIVPYVFLHTYADIHVRLSVKKWKHIPPFLRFRRFPRDEETQITVWCASVRAALGCTTRSAVGYCTVRRPPPTDTTCAFTCIHPTYLKGTPPMIT